jgi:hypothetical protein
MIFKLIRNFAYVVIMCCKLTYTFMGPKVLKANLIDPIKYVGCLNGIPYGYYYKPLPQQRKNIYTLESCQKIAKSLSFSYMGMLGTVRLRKYSYNLKSLNYWINY